MTFKKLILSLIPVLAVGALVGCGQTNESIDSTSSESPETSETESVETPSETESEDTPSESETPVEKTKITLWTTLSYQTQIENMVATFEAANESIEVENVKVSGGYDDLKEQTIAGFPTDNYPDLVLAYPDHVADYLDYNKAADITPYMEHPDYGWTEDDFDDVVPNFLSEGQSYSVEGTYSLPFCKSTEGMFYNADILIGLNLAAVDSTINNGKPLTAAYINSLTWDELFNKLCPALIEYNEKADAKAKILDTSGNDWAVVGYDSDDNLFITLAEQYGLPYTDIVETTGKGQALWNTPEMKDLMRTFNHAKNNHYFMTKGTNNDANVNKAFVVNKCLFSIGSTGGVKYQHPEANPFNVNVTRIPQVDHDNFRIINQGPSLAFLKHPGKDGKTDKTRLEAVWKFYKHMAIESNVTMWSTATGYMPTRYSSYESEEYLEYSNVSEKEPLSIELLTAKNATYCGEVLNGLFTSPVFKGSSECREQVGGLLTALLLLTPQEFENQVDSLFETSINNALLKM